MALAPPIEVATPVVHASGGEADESGRGALALGDGAEETLIEEFVNVALEIVQRRVQRNFAILT